jgi:vacuolar-type H+-ATPase subunit H
MNRVWGRRGRGTGADAERSRPDPTTAHQMVQDLERSIAARLAAVGEEDDEVARARVEADRLVAEAQVRADEAARERTAAILSAARMEAKRLVDAGARRANDLTEFATTRLGKDVSAVVSSILPEANSSSREEAS